MKTHFAFGRNGIEFTLPDGYRYQLLQSRTAPALGNAEAAIEAALDRPIGCPPLSVLAAGKRSAAISVCDITRPAPNAITLPPLLARLESAGIPRDGITLLIATGLHRPATEDEILRIVGPAVASTCRIVNHHAREISEHRALGSTRRGTPVYIDERFMAADLHITLGFVEQHLMLGFSGGRKLIVPGLAAQETIKVIHSPAFMREPLATEGSIAGNPLHAELLEIAAMARHDFMLDVTLTPAREISGVFAGHPHAAHAAGVEFIESTSLETIPEAADAVITSSAGYPLDLTLYQTIKGITAAEHLVKPGGPILLIGECAEGVGSPEFSRKLETFEGCQQYLDEILGKPVEVDQWQLEKLALTARGRKIVFYTPGVSSNQLGCFADTTFSDLNRAIACLLDGLPPRAQVALVPEGPYTFARALQPVA